MTTKPCQECGAPKKAGHPKWCSDCLLAHQPLQVRIEEARASRDRMLGQFSEAKRPPRETWPVGGAWCGHCLRFRRTRWFSPGKTQCKPCTSDKSHEAAVVREFGLAPGQYESMMEAQDGKCAVCRRRQKAKRLAVHHDHSRGQAIALLCQRCNHDLLGAAFDSADILLCAYAVQLGGWSAVSEVLAGGIDQLYRWIKDNPDALNGTKDQVAPW